MGGTHVYLWLIHVDVWQKPSQYFKLIILQLNYLILKKKIGWRNINSLRYEDYTTLMAESEEELKNLLVRVKEESERAGLKLNIIYIKKKH